MENHWSFKVIKILDLVKFKTWAMVNLPTDLSFQDYQDPNFEVKWQARKWIVEYKQAYEDRLKKELINICEYSIDFVEILSEKEIKSLQKQKEYDAYC